VSKESDYAAFKEASLQNKIMSDAQMGWLLTTCKLVLRSGRASATRYNCYYNKCCNY
jgi:hypothetical protein